jgi:hypothetical protein
MRRTAVLSSVAAAALRASILKSPGHSRENRRSAQDGTQSARATQGLAAPVRFDRRNRADDVHGRSPWVPLRPVKDVCDRLRVPLAQTARRGDTSCVERFRNLPEGTRAGLLCLAYRDDIRITISLGFHGVHIALAGCVEPRVSTSWGDRHAPNASR